MGEKSFDLPQDIWYQIFKKLEEEDLEQVSLVSKQFLSITNPLKTSLNILDETLPILLRVLRRFQHLESITISSESLHCCVDLLLLISRSGIDSEGRKNLKRLKFWKWYDFGDKDFIAIEDLFPWLEEIISPLSANSSELCEFQNLILKLTGLKKVIFGWDSRFASDESLVSLSSKYMNLEEIDIERCVNCITEETVGFVIRHSPKLTALKLPNFREPLLSTSFSIQNSIAYVENLHTLSLHASSLSKELVQSIAGANPLKKLGIEFIHVGQEGEIKNKYLLKLLRTCSSLEHFSLTGDKWLLDSSVDTISQHLTKLTRIDLTSCLKFTNASFFTILKKCPLLEEIKAANTSIGVGEYSRTDLHKREKIQYLSLSSNEYLDDKTLRDILWVCPNLRIANVGCCSQLTEESVRGILKTCVLLAHLKIYQLDDVSDIFGKYFEGRTVNLKILEAGETKLDDKALGRIGKICSDLEFLSIWNCQQVTKNGVMEVVRNCKKLKKINLNGCRNLSIDILGDMVRSRPSIKRILPPTEFVPSKKQKNLFWKNGCKICDWSDDDFSWC